MTPASENTTHQNPRFAFFPTVDLSPLSSGKLTLTHKPLAPLPYYLCTTANPILKYFQVMRSRQRDGGAVLKELSNTVVHRQLQRICTPHAPPPPLMRQRKIRCHVSYKPMLTASRPSKTNNSPQSGAQSKYVVTLYTNLNGR